ncbi:MAG: hypothetical protein QCI38_01995, partial [Candidatus Thermoplasmatota archaeon]|nr:hypothetical protein [Candidatus Thermoplasmatota archaeon]
TAQEIVDYCYGTIASAKVPRYVFVGEDIPVSGRGKVQKFKLREQLHQKIKDESLRTMVPTKVAERAKKD